MIKSGPVSNRLGVSFVKGPEPVAFAPCSDGPSRKTHRPHASRIGPDLICRTVLLPCPCFLFPVSSFRFPVSSFLFPFPVLRFSCFWRRYR